MSIKTMMAAKIGFTKVLDRKCPTHGGHYSSYEKSVCPKCSAGLVELTRVTEDGGVVKYCMTEVTLYPTHRQSMKDNLIKRTEAANGLLYTYRLILFGNYDKATDTVTPDKRTQYLVPKRMIRLELNDFPVLKPYFSVQANAQKIEVKFIFTSMLGDQLEYMDDKQEAQHFIQSAEKEKAEIAAGTATGTSNQMAAEPTSEMAQLQGMMKVMLDRMAKIDGGRTVAEEKVEVHHKSEMVEEATTTSTAPDPFPGASVEG